MHAAIDAISPLLSELVACLCAELENTVSGPVCRCCMVHGQQAVIDACCNDGGCADCPSGSPCEQQGGGGQAWVRLDSAFPSDSFPSPRTGSFDCPPGFWAMTVELGVARCACLPDDNGKPPSCDCLEREVLRAMSDRAAMLNAIYCCFMSNEACERVSVGQYTPLRTQGGCMGGTMQVTIPFSEDLCCEVQ